MKTKITIKEFTEAVNFKINEGFKYQWNCYGPNACAIGWEEKRGQELVSAGIVYDTETYQVYEMSVWDIQKIYRWISPKFINKVKKEYRERNLNYKIALDLIKFEDLTPTRILNKLKKLAQ